MALGGRTGDLLARSLVRCTRSAWMFERFVTGFLEEAARAVLDESGRRAFTDRVWEASGVLPNDDPLFAWEEHWFGQDLPATPAKVLVGAAGRGREARHLVNAGHVVTAFEPVRAFVGDLERAGAVRAEALAYEDLAARRDAGIWTGAPYDAFLLGWGSFSCLQSRRDRAAILAAGRALVPRGPILLSFLPVPRGESRSRTTGRALARSVGLRWDRAHEGRRDRLYAHLGFVHPVDDGELRELAAETGSRLKNPIVSTFEYPHATLLPRD